MELVLSEIYSIGCSCWSQNELLNWLPLLPLYSLYVPTLYPIIHSTLK